jgi:S1-C subfamily serine protease
MRRKRIAGGVVPYVFAAIMVSLCVTPLCADETAKAARDILNKYQDAVIAVELTIEQNMFGMRKTESKSEVTGTVIDPSGLTVLSLFTTDPGAIFELYDLGEMAGEPGANFKMESQVKDVKMIMPDGKEVPAQIVLRDKDLDLAFVRPMEKSATPFAAVDPAKVAKPEVLDQVVVVTRLGKVASRVPSVSLSRIQAIVKKPRTFYVPGGEAMEGGLGSPAFGLDGKLAGVLVLRTMKSRGIGLGNMFSGLSGMGMLPVVLPADDIAEVAKQAPEAKKVEEPKAEEKPAEEKKTEEKKAPEKVQE